MLKQHILLLISIQIISSKIFIVDDGDLSSVLQMISESKNISPKSKFNYEKASTHEKELFELTGMTENELRSLETNESYNIDRFKNSFVPQLCLFHDSYKVGYQMKKMKWRMMGKNLKPCKNSIDYPYKKIVKGLDKVDGSCEGFKYKIKKKENEKEFNLYVIRLIQTIDHKLNIYGGYYIKEKDTAILYNQNEMLVWTKTRDVLEFYCYEE